MPQMNFLHTLDVNLERFLEACSDSELIELDFLLDREFRIRKEKEEIKINEIDIKKLKG
jgi:hypothetical protein